MNSDALSVDANPALSPNVYQMDEESKRIVSYIHKTTHVILLSRQLLNNNKDDEKKEEKNDQHNDEKTNNNFQLNISNCNILINEINDKYLSNWNPHQSSLTFTLDISIQFPNETDDNLTNKNELIEQWKIVFNHGNTEHIEHNKSKNQNQNKINIKQQLTNQMTMQLRSLLSYIQLLPAQNILTPSNIVNTMDLFNLGIDVENDENFVNDANKDIPFNLTYRLSSAYEQAVSFPYPKSKSELRKKINTDGNIEISRFHDYDEIDYYLFPLLEFGEIGSLQLSVFYIDNDKFNRKFIENNKKLLEFISSNNTKKKWNNKYLELKVNQYIEEKQQQQIVLNAIEENKNININDEKEALYVDEDEYENDKLLEENKPLLLPTATVINDDKDIDKIPFDIDKIPFDKEQKKKKKGKKSKPGKMSKFFDKISKMKINPPRPCNLCIQILTEDIVKIGWKSDKSLKDYDTKTNFETKKFKFEIRSRKISKLSESDNKNEKLDDDITTMIENRRITIKETLGESIIYKGLECGNVYKFQVRIIDNMNKTFVSKWSTTLSVVIPGSDINESKYDTIDDIDTNNNTTEPKDHREMIEQLKLEELQNLCAQLLTKVTTQQKRINEYQHKQEEWEDTLNIIEKQKDILMRNLKTVQRSLRIKHNQYNELNIVSEENWNIDEKEGESEVLLRKKIPSLSSLLQEWNDLKMDVHLKLWVALCEEFVVWYANDPNKRSMVAFEVLFDILMYCYKEMMNQEQILGGFEDDDQEQDEKEIKSHNILCNMDVCFGYLLDEKTTADDSDNVNDKRKIYAKFCRRIVNTVIFNALKDKQSKWAKFNLLQKKEIEFALNDYVCECCRIIWCLLCLSKDNYGYILYPTCFSKTRKQSSKSKIKVVDMEFGMDTYGDSEDIEIIDYRIIVENNKSIKINKMESYDEKIHKKEMGSANNEKRIEYCSWPSIVKAYPSIDGQSSGSNLFGRLSNSDINSNEEEHQFLTRAFVFCCL